MTQPSVLRDTPVHLSDRERQVLALVSAGMTDKEIADRLYLSRHTVSHIVLTARRKLGASSRSAAVAMVVRLERLW